MEKKCLTLLVFLVLSAFLFSRQMPFGLDSSFDINYLILNDFELQYAPEFSFDNSLSENEKALFPEVPLEMDVNPIQAIPPSEKVNNFDKNIEIFVFSEIPVFEGWLTASFGFKPDVPYQDIYSYLEGNFGKGISTKNTKFLIERYSKMVEAEEVLEMKFMDEEFYDLIDFYTIFIASYYLSLLLQIRDITEINMWQTNDLLIISAYNADTKKSAIQYYNKIAISNFLITYLYYLQNSSNSY